MALKRDKEATTLSTQIGVTRGRGALNVSQAISSRSSHLSKLLSTYVEDGMAKEKAADIKEGKRLAKGAEIIFEDYEYTDSTGQTVTTKIPVSYKTPEAVTNNNWLALGFDEDVLDTYMDAVQSSAFQIIENEKNLIKSQVGYNNTVPELNEALSKNTQQQLDAIRNNMAQELRPLFDARITAAMTTAKTEISNRFITRKEKYENAKLVNQNNLIQEQLKTMYLTDFDGAKKLIDKMEDNNRKGSVKGLIESGVFLDTELEGYRNTLKLSKFLTDNKIFNLNYGDTESNQLDIENLQQTILFLESQGKSTVTLKNKEGKTVNLTIKDLGLSEDQFLALAPQLSTNARTTLTMLNSKQTVAKSNLKIQNLYKQSKEQNKSFFIETTDVNDTATKLNNLNDPLWDDAIADYALSQNKDITADNMSKEDEIGFYQYYASITGVIPDKFRTSIESTLGDVNDLANIKDLIKTPEWQIMNGVTSKTEGPGGTKIITKNLWNTVGLDADVESKALRLSSNLFLYGNEVGPQIFMQNEERLSEIRKLKGVGNIRIDELIKEYAEKKSVSLEKLTSEIETKILAKIPEKFRGQTIVGEKYMALIKNDIMRKLSLGSSQSVADLTNDAMAKINKNEFFGNSKYGYTYGGRVSGGNVEYGVDEVFMKYPPDSVLQSEKQLEFVNQRINQRFVDLSTETDIGTVNPGLSPEFYSQDEYEKVLEIGSNTRPGGARYITMPEKKQDFVLGENVFLKLDGVPSNQNNAVYSVMYLGQEEDGATALPLEDQNGNIIKITYLELLDLSE